MFDRRMSMSASVVIYLVSSAFHPDLVFSYQSAEVFRYLVEMQAEALCDLLGRAGPSFQHRQNGGRGCLHGL